MSDSMNANPSFVGQVLLTGGVLEMGARTIASSADLPIVATDQNLNVTAAQDLTITLPLPAALGTESGSRKLRFFDGAGVWGAHPVTFVTSGGALIDGQPQVTISQPWGSVEFEWRGTYWHATGLNASFGGLGGGLGIDFPPDAAQTDDDEFNALTLGTEWTVTGAAVVVGDPQRGGAFAGPATVRHSQSLRTGWLLIQPSSDGNPVQYHKPLVTALTQGAVYTRFSMDSNATVGPDSFSFSLMQTLAGVPDLNNEASVSLQRSVADNSWTIVASKTIAGVNATVYTATLTQMTQPVARLQITRNGTTFALYAGSSQGGMKFLGSFVSAGLNPDRLVITAATTGVPPSIFGLDYVRRIDGVNPTV